MPWQPSSYFRLMLQEIVFDVITHFVFVAHLPYINKDSQPWDHMIECVILEINYISLNT